MKADRHNSGKPKLSMIDTAVQTLIAEVLEFGAQKYDRDNWRKGLDYTTIIDSLLRHLNAFKDGQDLDPESGLSHIGHIGCNVMFLARFWLDKRQDLDDRYKGETDGKNEGDLDGPEQYCRWGAEAFYGSPRRD